MEPTFEDALSALIAKYDDADLQEMIEAMETHLAALRDDLALQGG